MKLAGLRLSPEPRKVCAEAHLPCAECLKLLGVHVREIRVYVACREIAPSWMTMDTAKRCITGLLPESPARSDTLIR